MLEDKEIKQMIDAVNRSLSRLLKKLDKMEKRLLVKTDLTSLENKLDTFIYYLKRLQIKQEILEEQIKDIQKILKTSSHN